MRVLLDFLPLLARGGGLQNARNLWRTLNRHGGDHDWLVVARDDLGLEAPQADRVELRVVSPRSLVHRVAYENVTLARLASRWQADVVWTPMGAGPLRSPVPRVMGWHDSSLAYPESVVHRRLGPRERAGEILRGRMARSAARGARAVTVQTATMRRRLARVWEIPESRFHVVPNGPSTFLAGESPAPVEPAGPPTVLVVAEAKPAKNLEIVPGVARRLREMGPRDVRVVMTVPSAGDAMTRSLDRAMAAEGADEGKGIALERVGRVPHEELGALYRRASAVFLPSLFESFSATYLEAMHFGVPLVTSDMDFARELCGDAAMYADPLDPDACAAALHRALTDRPTRLRLREEGFRRVKEFPTWEKRLSLYVAALEAALPRPHPVPLGREVVT